MGTNRLMTTFMFIAVFSLLSISLSYNPQEAFASVTGGFATHDFEIVADPTLAPINGQVGEDSQQDSTVFAFDEKTDFELPVEIALDLSAMEGVTVAAGKVVSSTTVVFDPPTTSLTSTQGCVSFDGQDVLGIQFKSQTLIDSDPILGHPDVTYLGPELRGIEPPPHNNADLVFFIGPKICFDLRASTPGDTFRVITTSDHVSTLLWQIGTFDNSPSELSGAGGLDYDGDVVLYDVDGIDPKYPKALGSEGGGLTTQVDISFTSESCQNAMLIYSRAGVEDDEIYLDGFLKGTVMSAEGVFDTSSTELGPLSAGSHIITVKYIIDSNNTPDNWHNNDALALTCWEDGIPIVELAELHVSKFYDANADGERNNGEPEIADWLVEVAQFDGDTDIIVSSSTALTTLWLELENGEYLISEEQVENWVPTNYEVPPILITEFYSDATVTVSSNTRVAVDDDETIVEFGNVCLGDGGAHSKGFWGNKNGQKLIGDDDLDDLNTLNLVDDDGDDSDFTGKKDLKKWLKDARAKNMAYMLSAQLAAMQLNMNHGVSPLAIVYAPGVDDGFVTVQELIDLADAALLANPNTTSNSPDRDYQEALKDALDDGDNNLNFVQPDICEPFVAIVEEEPLE